MQVVTIEAVKEINQIVITSYSIHYTKLYEIQLLTKTFTGTALGYYMLYPNPENPKKYVVLWGGNNLQHVIPRKGIPALNGYFDYEIYSYDTTYQYLLDNGYFTTRWLIQE